MFAYTNESLMGFLNDQLADNKFSEKCKLRVICRIALMVRKFQKSESENFIRSIKFEFSKHEAKDELKSYFGKTRTNYDVKELENLVCMIRKFDLNFEEVPFLNILDLLENNEEETKLYFLKAFKYLCRNSSNLSKFFKVNKILSLIKTNKNYKIWNELVWSLGYVFDDSKEKINGEIERDISTLVINNAEICDHAKAFLISRIEASKSINDISKAEHYTNKSITIMNKNYNNKRNQLVVTKTIQTVKSTVKNRKSEETDFKILNLASALKNRNKKANIKVTIENIETVSEKSGDDRSMWRTTWGECVNLYQLAMQNQLLKQDDKDVYLPDKLLGWHFFKNSNGLTSRKLFTFFINRMIVATFLKISKKQELNNKTLEKLFSFVKSFNKFISTLFNNEKIENVYIMFVNGVYEAHDDLIELKEPDIVTSFSKSIINKTIRIEVVRGWIWDTKNIIRLNYDQKEVNDLIIKEIEKIRLDAVNALYNSVLRDKKILTNSRLKVIQDCLDDNDINIVGQETNEKFKNILIRILDLVESNLDLDYKKLFKFHMNTLKSSASSEENVISAINFINGQSRDYRRCNELFTAEVIQDLVHLLQGKFKEQAKEYFLEIINNYLEHETTSGLNEKLLKFLIESIIQNNSSRMELIDSAFLSILLTTEKNRSLPKLIIANLIENIDYNFGDYVVLVLSRISFHIEDKKSLEKISHKLKSDNVIVNEDSKIKFEKSSNSNSGFTPISLITCKLILFSVENKVKLNYETVNNLLVAIEECEDKQTKINASKCIDLVSIDDEFDSDTLVKMQKHLNHEVYDISVYIHSAYARSLLKLSKTYTKPIESIHLDILISLLTHDRLIIGEKEYSDEINRNILEILKYEAKKRKFEDDDLFTLMNGILLSNEKYAFEVLDILEVYTTCKNIVPLNTIVALENTLGISDLFEKALFILQNIIRNNQIVTNKTLQIFADNLYTSMNSRRRLRSFKLLDQAKVNQDLPEEVFCKIELQKAGYGLASKILNENQEKNLLNYIFEKTSAGNHLPIDTMKALEEKINNIDVLRTLVNVSNNKQILNYDLINKLVKNFNPQDTTHNCILISVFENIARNNQTLSPELLKKLELALKNLSLQDQVLSIFVLRGQKGENLSKNIIEKILDKITTETNIMIKQEFLSSLVSIIQTNSSQINLYKCKLEDILSNELKSENVKIQKICLNTWMVLMKFVQIDSKFLNQIVQIGTEIKTDESVCRSIYSLLNSVGEKQSALTKNLLAKIELANLSFKSNDELLERINKCVSDGGELLSHNYNQLAKILDEDSDSMKLKALNLLISTKSRNQISTDLIESLAVLFESSNSNQIQENCLKILEEIKTNGENKLTVRAENILNEKNENWKIDYYKTKFSKSMLYTFLKEQFKLDDLKIRDLLSTLKISKSLVEIKNLAELLEAAVTSNINYCDNSAFVFLVEQMLLTKNIYPTALLYYNRIIIAKKYQNLEEVLNRQIVYYYQTDNKKFKVFILPLLVECIYNALKTCNLPDICLKLLEENIENQNELVRSFSFKGLRTATTEQKYNSEFFNNWCAKKLEYFSLIFNIKLSSTKSYLDLLEVILSLSSVDLSVLKKHPENLWPRELIVSNLFLYFRSSDEEQLNFYSNWFPIENKFKSISIRILILIQQKKSFFNSLSQINEIFVFIKNWTYKYIMSSINNELTPYKSLKLKWCKDLIESKTNNLNNEYLVKLAEILCERVSIKFIEKLFQSISAIDNLKEFESLIDFCVEKDIKNDDLCFRDVGVYDFKKLIEVRHICNTLKSGLNNGKSSDTSVLFNLLFNLIKKNWKFDQLLLFIELIKNFRSKDLVKNCIDFLSIIHQYNLGSSKYNQYLNILTESKTIMDLLKSMNKLSVENNFQLTGKIKNAAILLDELKELNSNNLKLLKYINDSLLDELEMVKSESFTSTMYSNPICTWSEKQINAWSEKVKSSQNCINNVEALAVIKQANFIFTGFHLTDTQILSCLISLDSEQANRGTLLQVATGEGKSTIVCILAIINALKETVNVITSSPVLAERDAKEKAKLFKMFRLTCSSNNDLSIYLKGPKDCYKADIVYGEVSQFQFDQLRDNYSQLGTLANRKCNIAIIDEVDAMLIDDSSKISRLSSTAAGMDHFQLIYTFIWQKLLTIKEKFIMFNNKMYLIDGKVQFENGYITLEYANKLGEIFKIENLEDYVSQNGDISEFGKLIDTGIDEFLKKTLNDYIDALIQDDSIKIPDNFKDFFDKQRQKWINNSIEALNYQENIHYVVQEGQIKPVDYYSTGIVQSSTNWSDGLHQFLQLKHNLKLTCETFTTNFLSNIGFINSYKRIYGLTGTLGSEKARDVLKDVYKVDLINIPQLRQKQYIEFPNTIALNEAKWMQEICSAALLETNKDRGVLIICETIEQANIIGERLKAKYRPGAIKLYTMNNMNQEKQVEQIQAGEIIIATNLCGRGTDIRTDAIEDTGGLHVILIFMPNNQRVEDQAFGRTARQGKRGTGQMILNLMSLINFNNFNPNEIKTQRDLIECKQLDEFQNNELKLIVAKDKLFKGFCDFLNNEIRNDIREKNGTWQKFKDKITYATPTVYEYNVLAAIEEQWAMFLHKLDENIISIENSDAEFSKLISNLRKDYQSGNVMKNSYYNIAIANDLLVNEKNPDKAAEYFERAAKSNPDFYGAAHVGLAWCSISSKKNEKAKQLDWLNKALKILSNEMASLNSMQVILQNRQEGFVNSDLDKQLSLKSTILGSYLNSVQNCTAVIKKSLRLIDVVKIDQNTEELYFDLERNEKNEINIKWENNAKYNLTFNDLTQMVDSGTIDQAIQTIDAAHTKISKTSKLRSLLNEFEEGTLESSYDHIRLQLNQVSLDRLKILFNSNQDFEEITDYIAIGKLKEKRSYLNAITNWADSYEVDLKIIDADNKIEKIEKKSINDAIEIIENKKDPNLRYCLTIKNANVNEINSYYLRNPYSKNIYISFEKLDYNSLSEKLKQIKPSSSVTVEMFLTKSILLPAVKSGIINCAKICTTENKKYETIEKELLLKHILQLKQDDSPFHIKIENLKPSDVQNIVNNFQDQLFNIQFSNISFSELWNILNNNNDSLEAPVTLCFENLNKINAKKFIDVLRKESFEFCLEFKNLDHKQVKFIIKHAHLQQEKIEITKVRNLSELFMNNFIPSNELIEFSVKGIEYLLDISEKRFIPWRSICIVAALGTLQVIAGGILIATGFGASIGMSFISEGLADMFTAIRAYSSRQFSWTDYCKQKAVSLVISAISAGYGKIKDAAKGASTLTSEVTKEGLEQAGTQLVQNGKSVGQQMMQTGKNLKSLAFKYTGVKAGEAVAREGLNNGVQYLTNLSLDLLKPQISQAIQHNIRNKFCAPELVCLLRKMHAIDTLTKSKLLQGKVDKIVLDAMNPERNFLRKQWSSIGLPLLKGVLSSSDKYGSAISMSFRIWGTLQGLNELRTIIDYIYAELVTKLSQIDKNSMTITLFLHQNLKIEKEKASDIARELRTFRVFNENDNFFLSSNDDDNEKKLLKDRLAEFRHKTKNNKVFNYIDQFCDEYFKTDVDTSSMIMKSVSDKLTDQITNIIESQLVSPWSTYAVSSLTDSLSKRIQHHCLVDREQNSDSQNKDHNKYDELKKKQENNEPLTDDEKQFMTNYGSFRTLGEQINYNARDYCIAYSQCEMIYNALHPKETTNPEELNEETKKQADNVRNNKPATIGEMTLLANKNGINLKVVDDINYERTQEEIDAGVEIVYIEKGSKNDENVDGIGHAYYMDQIGNFVDVKTNPNDCFYGVMSVILENKGITKSIEDLRNDTADAIQSNSNYSNTIAAENWIYERHSYEANTLLFAAGLKYNEKTGRLEVEDKDMRELNVSVHESKQRGRNSGPLQEGAKYNDEYFKDELEQSEYSPPLEGVDLQNHHIISNSNLETMIPKYKAKDIKHKTPAYTEGKKELEDYLNLPHIKNVIVKNEMLNKTENHGEVIHSAISWNPDNIVKGPKTRLRFEDPKSDTDNEILKNQTDKFQDAVSKITCNLEAQTLSSYAIALRESGGAKPVQWVGDTKEIKGEMKTLYKAEKMNN
ncbi:unnamed protein product [Brachionus calyciflorus]|uniref:Protein translocase subunit SecA n=1 Tax=Brachionus calyciflorus TaxID=104777 RepID=A0A813Q5V4_9BILA|nr:unnamed protein product [Brachionus calyciflorus]